MLKALVGACAINTTAGDVFGNVLRIIAAINAGKKAGVKLLCFPELAITGYGCEDHFFAKALSRKALEALSQIIKETEGIAISVGLPLMIEGKLYNAVAMIADGKLLGFGLKQHLAGDGIHYEPRWYTAWKKGRVISYEFEDYVVPVGDLVFEFDGIKVGLEICEDAWVNNRPANDLAQQGVQVILNPSASHFAFYKRDKRRSLVVDASSVGSLVYIYVNLLGNEAGTVIYDGHTMIASGGSLLVEGERMSYADYTLSSAVVDIGLNDLSRRRTTSYKLKKLQKKRLVTSWFSIATDEPRTNREPAKKSWEDSNELRFEEFRRVTALGLFDYLCKTKSQRYVVSLSGGRDSALVALCVYEAMACAIKELGWAGVRERLSHIKELREGKITNLKQLMRHMLWTIYQPTENSGDETQEAANVLAEGLGAKHEVFDVNWAFKGYRKTTEKALGRKLSWETDRITLENLQARVRAPGLWALTNVEGGLLLTTSNRSEGGVGYFTTGGDTSGGLNPIGGISKPFIIAYLDWYARKGPFRASRKAVRNALGGVVRLKPTAELCPSSFNQTDEGDLMPYPVLDRIEHFAMQERLFPLEVFETIVPEFKRWSAKLLCGWTAKWFSLFERSQWKREQLPKAFHLDDRNLDPRSWGRHPIISKTFVDDIEALKAMRFEEAKAA